MTTLLERPRDEARVEGEAVPGHAPVAERPDGSAPGAMAFDERRIGRTVNALAWPIIAEMLFQTALSIVDMWMIAFLGAAAIAGVGASIQIIFVLASLIGAIMIGTTALVARARGAGDLAGASYITKQSMLVGLAASAVLMLLGFWLPEPLLHAMGLELDVVAVGNVYLTWLLLPAVAFVMPFVLGAALRGAGDSRSPMIATGLMNVLNVAFAWVLIFGNLGFPAMGVLGAALAAALGRAVGSLYLLWVVLVRREPIALGRGGWRPDLEVIGRIIRIGLPAGIEQVIMSAGFLVYGLVAVGMGTLVFAVQRITWNAIGISVMPGFGFAMAASALTGQALGAGRPDLARKMTWYATWSAALWMGLAGLLFFVGGEWLMRPFTDDPEMIRLGAEALRVIAISQPIMAIGLVLSGGLRGAGDTRFPLLTTALTIWGVRVPFGWLFGAALGLGLPGFYAAGVVDSVVRSLVTWLRYRRSDWEELKV